VTDKHLKKGHRGDEAEPQEIQVPRHRHRRHRNSRLHDSGWSEEHGSPLLKELVGSGIAKWKDVTALVLGQLNPSQSARCLASSEGFKRRYGKGKHE
jgi:hypothetical protein